MSILSIFFYMLLAVVFAFIPAVFLRVAGNLVTKVAVPSNLAYLLTVACYVPAVGVLVAVREAGSAWITGAALTVPLLIVPAFVYGRYLKSIEGRSIGPALGFAVAAVQLIAMIVVVSGIAYAIQLILHP